MKKYIFNAGPSILPEEVLQQASEAVIDLNKTGLSLIEISHRSKDFIAIMEEARTLVKKLMKLDDNHEVLFLQGGASLQFAMIPYNLIGQYGKAAYVDSGNFASAAIKEAKKITNIEVIASSKDDKYTYTPTGYTIPTDVDYLHLTSNNTVYGTQIKEFPVTNVPIVCDMSSDILSRELDFNKFGLIYAGAQKNLGPAGVTIVIVDKTLLGKKEIPSILDYQVHISKESMANTPGVFAVYTTMLNLRWLDKQGGVSTIERKNKEKADLLYQEIDRNPLFKGIADKEHRSLMNACFKLTDEEKYKERFDAMWKEAGIVGIGGYRTVGGYRASIYNAMPIEGVQLLVNVMKELEKTA